MPAQRPLLTFTYHENAWEVKAVSALPDTSLHEPGAILLVSCYELGHQPLGVAWPRAFLERAGYAPDALDLAVEPLDEGKVRRARLITIAVPMHTALRVGVRAAERMRQLNPGCTIVFAGLYAILNAEHLLGGVADVCASDGIGGGPLAGGQGRQCQ